MQIFESLAELDLSREAGGCHVAVGTLDGVHRGHAVLIEGLARKAREEGGKALVFTFQNHPRAVVAPASCPPLLSPWPLKRRLLERLPLDYVVALEFDREFAATPAEAFIRDVLVGRCGARSIHSGKNFHFGRGGAGGPALLRSMAEELGYEYVPLEVVELEDERISSTRIRECLAGGRVADAARMLGRPHQVSAPVVTGDRIGRTIGFPTANLDERVNMFLPADGVYAVLVRIEEEEEVRPGMMNLGVRPTVAGREHRSEVHLLDFKGDLAEKSLTVLFIERLRNERKFAGVEELKAQLERDRESAREALSDISVSPS